MSEDEKVEKVEKVEPAVIYVEHSFWRGFYDLPWFGIILTIVVCLAVSAVIFVIYLGVNSYRGQCHDAGGHIIEVRDAEICVDRDNRVIFL